MTSRLLFPEDRTAFVYGAPGQPICTPPRTGLRIFLDETATQVADILGMTGIPVPYSTIYTESDSLLPEFQGPEGLVSRLWAQVIGGTPVTYPLMAQYSDQLTHHPSLLHGDGPPSPEIGTIGSFYIDRGISLAMNVSDNPVLYGPRTEDGWPAEGTLMRGEQGLPGASQEWVQSTPEYTWTIDHALTYRPAVTTIDSAGQEIHGDVDYPPALPSRIFVHFGAPESGIAILT